VVVICREKLGSLKQPRFPRRTPREQQGKITHVAYFIDVFSRETYEAFTRSDREVSGFRLRHRGMADRIRPGDIFVCCLTRLSHWVGVLKAVEGPFVASKPIFVAERVNWVDWKGLRQSRASGRDQR
jgi:hypothetical protein